MPSGPRLILAAVLLAASAASADPGAEAAARAAAAGLAEHPQWRRLMHARPGTFGGWTSQVDGPAFFLHPDGADDLAAELDATVRAFYAPPGEPDEHALCRFPARLAFLAAAVPLDVQRLPRVRCPGFEDFFRRAAPRGVHLVFSSYFLNNPASAFGHVFLRFEKTPAPGEAKRPELLDYGIDFGAGVDTDNALVYALRGMTGGYPGTFRLMPYFYKVREYSDFESRDLWTYRLRLDDAQRALLAAHLWELGSTWFDYFYLTENCAYHILGALEVVAPGRDLLDALGWPVIPADAVKAVAGAPGLVEDVAFRPSLRTVLDARLAGLRGDEPARVEAVAEAPAADVLGDVPVEAQVRVLDAAMDLVEARYARDLLTGPRDHPAHALKHGLLARRAALRVVSPPFEVARPAGGPHTAHGSHRVGLAGGADRAGAPYADLSLRLALHDLSDPPRGYPDLSGIEFFPVRLRVAGFDDLPTVEAAHLARIHSLTPLRRFQRALSWRFAFGGQRMPDGDGGRAFVPGLEVGGGVTVELFHPALTVFLLGDSTFQGPPLRADPAWPVRLGVGPRGGLRWRLGDAAALTTQGVGWVFPFQSPDPTWLADLRLRVRLLDALALDLGGRAHPDLLEADAGFVAYF